MDGNLIAPWTAEALAQAARQHRQRDRNVISECTRPTHIEFPPVDRKRPLKDVVIPCRRSQKRKGDLLRRTLDGQLARELIMPVPVHYANGRGYQPDARIF